MPMFSHSTSDGSDRSSERGLEFGRRNGTSRRSYLRLLGGVGGVLATGGVLASEGRAATASVGEVGRVRVNQDGPDEWHTVAFENAYEDPVVAIGPLSWDGRQPAHLRLRAVTGDGFEFKIEEWDYLDESHITATAHFIAVESGTHELGDGSPIHAGTVRTDEDFASVTLPDALSGESVVALSHAQTHRGGDAVVTRLRDVSGSSFDVRVQEQESKGGHTDETIGYIVLPETVGDGFEAGVTGATIGEGWQSGDFRGSYDDPRFVATLASYNGGNTAGLRYRDLDAEGADVFVEEERSSDDETAHVDERMAYVVADPGSLFDEDPVVRSLEVTAEAETDYRFEVSGDLRPLETVDSHDEVDTGAGTASGYVGGGYTDEYEFTGEISGWWEQETDGSLALAVDGTEVDTGSLPALETRTRTISFTAEDSLQYKFEGEYDVTALESAPDYGDYFENDQTVVGFVGNGSNDAWSIDGDLLGLWVNATGAYDIAIDGTSIDPDDYPDLESPNDGGDGSGDLRYDQYIPYDSDAYKNQYTRDSQKGRKRRTSSPSRSGKALEVRFAAGEHDGCDLRYNFRDALGSEPNEAWIRYHFYVDSDFEFAYPYGDPLGGKMGIGWANTRNGPASGGAGGTHQGRAFSVRPSMDGGGTRDGTLSNYTYHADSGNYGDTFEYNENGDIDFGQWYQIDHRLRMNTPGRRDGVMRAWVDGNLALNETDLELRDSDHSFGIGRVWHNCYFGGNWESPETQSICFEDLYVSTEGPIDDSLESA